MNISLKNTIVLILFCFSHNIYSLKKGNSIIIDHPIDIREEINDLIILIEKNRTSPQTGIKLAKRLLQVSINNKFLIHSAEAWEYISLFENDLGNNSKALFSAFNALKIFQKLNDDYGIASTHSNIASLYNSSRKFESSIFHFKKAKDIFKEYDCLYEIVSINNLGEVYRNSKKLDSAEFFLKEALSKISNEEIENKHLIFGYTLGNLGMVYNSKKEIDSALIYLSLSLEKLKFQKDYYSISIYTSELGKIHQKKKEYKKAKEKYHEALYLAQQDGLKEQIRDFNQLLSQFYTERKDYKKALYHQRQFQIYQDSLVNKENVRKIEQLKAGYEIDKRETQIGLLNKENDARQKRIIYLALGLGSLLILASLLFISRRRIRKANTILAQQKEEISQREQEKAWLLRELNHRVKNNLQMVASLLNLQSNKLSGHPAQEAILIGKQRVEALSLVHRKLYQEGVDTRINIKDYITELILGLFHAYNANFKPQIHIGDDISVNIDSAIPLALIVNEIIINCLKYAYEGIESPSLTIEIESMPDQRLNIHIFDNGIGFDEGAEMKDSLGMKIIKSLTRQLDGSVSHYNENGAHWQLNVLGK